MNQKMQQLFKDITEKEPTFGLKMAVFARIEQEEAKRLRRKLVLSRVFSMGSAIATLVAIVTLGGEFLHSEFINMAALFFSDMNTVVANWYDFGLSLLETFPTVTVSLILLPLFATLVSLGSYLDLDKHQQKYI